MTTMAKCKQEAKRLADPNAWVIVHTPGHRDDTKKATDRGYTLLQIKDVVDFLPEVDYCYKVTGELWPV